MEYKKDQYVVHNGFQICRIGDVVKKSFDGVGEKEYYILLPIDAKSTYYVPADRLPESVRPVLTKEQLLDLIDSLADSESEWIADRNARKRAFSDALKSGDYKRIIPLMNGIYSEKTKRESSGKKLFSEDKKNFESARTLLHSEIAFTFGIEAGEAEEYIQNRINER